MERVAKVRFSVLMPVVLRDENHLVFSTKNRYLRVNILIDVCVACRESGEGGGHTCSTGKGLLA